MKISVCKGSACKNNGASQVKDQLKELIKKHHLKDDIHVEKMPCQGRCKKGVCLKIHGEKYSITPDMTEDFFNTVILKELK